MSSPRFEPRLTPLTTRSGLRLRKPSTPRRTQSVGDPSVMYAFCPVRSCVERTRSGGYGVMLWLAPLQFRSGAMMSTSPTVASASASGPSASDSIPSSLVMRICRLPSIPLSVVAGGSLRSAGAPPPAPATPLFRRPAAASSVAGGGPLQPPCSGGLRPPVFRPQWSFPARGELRLPRHARGLARLRLGVAGVRRRGRGGRPALVHERGRLRPHATSLRELVGVSHEGVDDPGDGDRAGDPPE